MKKILIDTYKIKDLYSGLGQFSLNFMQEIVKHKSPEREFVFMTPQGLEINEEYKEYNIIKAGFQKRYFPSFNNKYDIWHSLHQFPSHLPAKSSKNILTIHDLNFLHEKTKAKATRYLKKLQKNVDRAEIITVISEYTKMQLGKYIDLKGKSVIVIYNGVNLDVFENPAKPVYIPQAKFFFAMGVFKEKKNFHNLLPLMEHFRDYKLVIAGNNNTAYGNKIRKQIKDSGLEDNIILPGKISDEEKYWLYSNCEAFILPSSIEGFGLPVIEAMLAGKPVFLSRYGSLPEIGGKYAFYFEGFNTEDMLSVIKDNLAYFNAEKDHYTDLIKKYAQRFSWETCISQYLSIYESLL